MNKGQYHYGRERMKSVMKVWTGVRTIKDVASNRKVSVKEIERWCKIAMRAAKTELAKLGKLS